MITLHVTNSLKYHRLILIWAFIIQHDWISVCIVNLRYFFLYITMYLDWFTWLYVSPKYKHVMLLLLYVSTTKEKLLNLNFSPFNFFFLHIIKLNNLVSLSFEHVSCNRITTREEVPIIWLIVHIIDWLSFFNLNCIWEGELGASVYNKGKTVVKVDSLK